MERNDFLYENASEQTDLLEKEADRLVKAFEKIPYLKYICYSYYTIIKTYEYAITSCENEEQKLRLRKKKTNFCQIMEDIFIKHIEDNINQIKDINQIEDYVINQIEDYVNRIEKGFDHLLCKTNFYQIMQDIFINQIEDNINQIEKGLDHLLCKQLIMFEFKNVMKVYDKIINSCENEEQKLELDNKKMDFCQRGINILKKKVEKSFPDIISMKSYNHIHLRDVIDNYHRTIILMYDNVINSFQDERKKLQLGMRKINCYKETINYCIKIMKKMDLDKKNRNLEMSIMEKWNCFCITQEECISAVSYQEKLSCELFNQLYEIKIFNKNVKDHELEIFSDKLKMKEILFNLRMADYTLEVVNSEMKLYNTTPNQYKNKYNEVSKCYKTILDICQNMPEKYYNESMKYYNKGKEIQAFKSDKKDMITDREKICKYMLAAWQYIKSVHCLEKVGKLNRIEGEIYEKIIELEKKKEPIINESIKRYLTHYEEDYKKCKSNLSKMSDIFI